MPRDNSKLSKFMAPVQPDAALAAIVGAEPLPRTEITKKLWLHIKAGELQDATDRRVIHCDGALRAVCAGRNEVTMFELPKLWGAHVSPVFDPSVAGFTPKPAAEA